MGTNTPPPHRAGHHPTPDLVSDEGKGKLRRKTLPLDAHTASTVMRLAAPGDLVAKAAPKRSGGEAAIRPASPVQPSSTAVVDESWPDDPPVAAPNVPTVIGIPALDNPLAETKPVDDALSAERPSKSPATLAGVGAPSPSPAPGEDKASGGALRFEDVPATPFARTKSLLDRWPVLRRIQGDKPPFVLPLLLGLGLVIALIGVGVLGKWVWARAARSSAPHRVASGAPPAIASTAIPASPPVIELDPKMPSPKEADSLAPALSCRLVGAAKSVAPGAELAAGVEVVATPPRITLGFAKRPNEAVTLPLNPDNLSALTPRIKKSKGVIRRVLPISNGDAAIFADGKRDPIASRYASGGPSPIDVGVASGHLVWAVHGASEPKALWPLDGDAPVEALRAVPFDASGKAYVVAFRRGGAIWMGAIARGEDNASFSAGGELSEAKGTGTQVGAPSLAVSGDTALLFWADQTDGGQSWNLRYRLWARGHEMPAPESFEVPGGGKGAPYISPSLAPIEGGRFLLVWTEGPGFGHQVRALTLSPDGHPLGAPLTISNDAANAGQGQAAVLPDGRGIIAYLAARGAHFELMAATILCPRP